MSRRKKSKTSERKAQLFPHDKRLVVSAKVVPIGDNYRIDVVSATLH